MDTQPQNNQTPSHSPLGEPAGEQWPGAVSRSGRNFALILAFGIVFLGVASLVKPNPRGASASPNRAYVAQAEQQKNVLSALAAQQHPKGWKLVGMLETKNFLVLIHAAPDAPRYSVFALSGELIKGDMLADDVYREFPTLDLKSLRLEPAPQDPQTSTGPLMMADPASQRGEHWPLFITLEHSAAPEAGGGCVSARARDREQRSPRTVGTLGVCSHSHPVYRFHVREQKSVLGLSDSFDGDHHVLRPSHTQLSRRRPYRPRRHGRELRAQHG